MIVVKKLTYYYSYKRRNEISIQSKGIDEQSHLLHNNMDAPSTSEMWQITCVRAIR